jgi:lipoyl(octanoyl) transferase
MLGQAGEAVPPRRSGATAPPILVRRLGSTEYVFTWRAMQHFTAQRNSDTADEIWVTQHPPVFTVGLNGKPEHGPSVPTAIPVVRVDRGGQITYHGPGQAVLYTLLDLKRRALGVRPLVTMLEQAVIDLLSDYNVRAERRLGAPGVYVGAAKIAALGLRIKNQCCYHGLAFNVDMDLSPFSLIEPCGYRGLAVTQAKELGIRDDVDRLSEVLLAKLINQL